MPEFSAKDVQRLRQVSGAGMMDAKRALTECDGEFEGAIRWLREKGLGKAGERSGRENVQGAVAVATAGNAAALVELKCETDFVAKSPDFVRLAEELAREVAKDGEQAASKRADAVDDLRIKLKENIELGQVVRFEAGPGHVLDTYLHLQSGRGVNGVLVELADAAPELAHAIAVHIA
ncbi:MAG TPA: translation elongation factor Ts, partial [Acidimicrobiales bacterium]|nr:translation elongation factor Ts [Acidimicrobiales bacterium]